jgi:uncharacterized membrane protein
MDAPGFVSRDALHAHSRVIVKTVCYRVFMFLITAVTALAVTGSPAEAISIGVATNLLKTFTYYGYEQAGAHITWGTATE